MIKLKARAGWLGLVVATAGLATVLAACGGGSKKKNNDTPTNTGGDGGDDGDDPVDTAVRFAGSLNLLNTDSSSDFAGAALAGEVYDIYCVTFEDTPVACRAEITDNKFDKTCENYAGKSFGCFLRKGGKTVGDIVFDQGEESDSQLVSGAGTIEFSLNFDAELGVATAVVDTAKSSALAADKVAAAKTAAGATTTTLPNLTGVYALKLLGLRNDDGQVVAAPEGDKGGDGGGVPESIYLNEFDDNGVRKVSIWNSQAAYKKCVPSGASENKPSFGATVGTNTRVAIDPANLSKYQDSMGTIIAQFAKDNPTAFGKLLDATGGQWEARRCQEQKENLQNKDELISETNCRLLSPGFREVKVWNPETNREETRQEPEWYQTWSDIEGKTSLTSGIVERQQECFNPLVATPDDKFMPPCPPNWNEAPENAEKATGTFTVYDWDSGSGTRPVQFLCKNPQDQNGGLMFFPVTKPTGDEGYLQASINAAKANNTPQDPSCAETTVAALFDPDVLNGTAIGAETVFKSSRRVVLQTFTDLLRSANDDHGGYNECDRWTKPADDKLANWNFGTECSNGGSPVCWQYPWLVQNIGVKLKSDQSDFETDPQWSTEGQPPFRPDTLGDLCPGVTFGPNNPSGESWEEFETRIATEKTNCRTDFLNATKTQRMSRLFDAVLDPSQQPPSVSLQCSDDQSTKDAVAALAASSCLPEVNIDFRCEGGNNCTEVLRCWGTEDGKCVDADGEFVGRVPGRFEKTTLKAGTNNAFSMNSLTIETWSQWGSKGEQVCKAARAFKLEGTKTADEPLAFTAFLNNAETRKCEGDDDSSGSGSEGGGEKGIMSLTFTKQ